MNPKPASGITNPQVISGASGSDSASLGTAALGTAAESVATKAKDAVEGIASSQFRSFSSEQMQRATGALSDVTSALRHTGQQLRQGDQALIAGYVDRAVSQLERVSNHLESKNVGELIREVEGYAKREPAVFIGGAFVLGLLGARFLKSSAPSRSFTGSQRPLAPTSGMSSGFRSTSSSAPIPSPYGNKGHA